MLLSSLEKNSNPGINCFVQGMQWYAYVLWYGWWSGFLPIDSINAYVGYLHENLLNELLELIDYFD